MKKILISGLVALFGFSNAALAASTSLSTTGSWQTATGSLSSLLGESAPATWNYNTDVSLAGYVVNGAPLLGSGGKLYRYQFATPAYTITNTAPPGLFNENQFRISLLDNTVATLDWPDLNLISALSSHGLNPNGVGDVVEFATSYSYTGLNGRTEYLRLRGLTVFKQDFFSGPIVSIPSGESLLDNALLIYGSLRNTALINGKIEEIGFANFAQSPSAVPVPAAAFLFAPALLGFLGLRRKTKSAVI